MKQDFQTIIGPSPSIDASEVLISDQMEQSDLSFVTGIVRLFHLSSLMLWVFILPIYLYDAKNHDEKIEMANCMIALFLSVMGIFGILHIIGNFCSIPRGVYLLKRTLLLVTPREQIHLNSSNCKWSFSYSDMDHDVSLCLPTYFCLSIEVDSPYAVYCLSNKVNIEEWVQAFSKAGIELKKRNIIYRRLLRNCLSGFCVGLTVGSVLGIFIKLNILVLITPLVVSIVALSLSVIFHYKDENKYRYLSDV